MMFLGRKTAAGPGEEAATDASGRAGSPAPGQPAGQPGQQPVAPPGEQQPAGAAPRPAEHEPDARYTFANERTFLAWIRTALALVAAGLAVIQLLPPFHGIRWGRHAIGIPLILLGGALAMLSYREWMANQRAIRRGEPLPRSWLPVVLAVTITAVGLVAAVLVVLAR
jgi:inner membrane protein YidH